MEKFEKFHNKIYTYRLITRALGALLVSGMATLFIGGFISLVMQTFMPFLVVFLIIYSIQTFWNITVVILESKNFGYVVHENSLGFRQGSFSVFKETIPFARITNASFNQSLIQRFFGVGDLDIDQEDSASGMPGIDRETANKILQVVSQKSNVQPIKA